MINGLKTIQYSLSQLMKNRLGFSIMLGGLAVIFFQLSSELTVRILSINQMTWPWSIFVLAVKGYLLPVFFSFIAIILLFTVAVFWLMGGTKRAIAQYLSIVAASSFLLNMLALAIFSTWKGLTIAWYNPLVVYWLFNILPKESTAMDHLVLCILSCQSLLVIPFLAKFFSVKSKSEKVFGKAHFSSAFEIEKSGLFAKTGIVLGKIYGQTIRLPGYEGVLVVAPTGGGKTTAIAVPNLLEWRGSGIFNDLKGELYRLTASYRQNVLKNSCYFWSPADSRMKGACYNPFFYVNDNPDLRIRDLQLIAEILIPATRLGEGFWYQSSRELFLTLSLYLFETKGMATLSEIHDLSKQECFTSWLYESVSDNDDKFSKHLKQNAYAILGGDEKTQKNILKDFHSRMGLFNDPLIGYATSKNDFDFRELRKKKMSIYIHIPDSDRERLSPILTLFWAQIINAMSSHEPSSDEPYGVLALMDEFGNMAKINKLKDGMSFLRSYHVRCVIIVQYLSQITSVYGRDDAKGFLNSKAKVTFSACDMDDAQFFSKALGTKTVRVTSSSVNTGHGDGGGSRSESNSFQSRPLMSADEIMQLSDSKEIILLEAKNPIKADKCYWFKEPAYQYLIENQRE